LNWKSRLLRLARIVFLNPLIYKVYEKALWYQIKDGRRPEHVGLILDGNRRWAFRHEMLPWIGHQVGADKVEDLLEWCLGLDIKSITLYVFSTENFNRQPDEVSEIMKIAEEKLREVLSDERIRKNRVHIKAIGRINYLPESVQRLVREAEESTKEYDNFYLNVAIAYGGRAEIVDAAKKIAEEVCQGRLGVEQIDEGTIGQYLYTSGLPKPEPDIIIRTSGEERLSGFLLWQSAYSELCFQDVYWPDFRRLDLWRAVRTFQRRQRRFGK
jgi:tritrans,polycis-undecaprenyl-diphosphate synthase [geranylgeranyl-diphosphate specific]